jgi:hypothetical protein
VLWGRPSGMGRGQAVESLGRVILLLAALVAVALTGFWLWTAWLLRDAQVAETQIKALNLASSVAQHAERSIEAIDIVVRNTLDRVEAGVVPVNRDRMRMLLSRRAAELMQVSAFSVVGPDGTILISSFPGSEGVSIADRDYFQLHRDHPGPGRRITGPLLARTSGHHVFVLSRTIRTPDGRFGGIVAAAIDMRFFQEFYDRLQTGEQGLILLSMDDGTLLVRHPYAPENVGRSLAQTGTIFTQLLARAPSGLGKTTSPIDGIVRWNAYRRLENSNLVVAAALSEAEELEQGPAQIG